VRLGTLIAADLARSKRRLAVVVLAVAASVGVVVLLGALVSGIKRHVVDPLLPQLPLDLLKVEPKTLSVGLLAFDSSSLGGGGLDDAAVDRLAKIEGVKKVYPVVAAAFPMRAEGGEGFIGHRMATDVFATGVAPELVRGDVAKGYTFEDATDRRVPVLVARRLLDLYNTTVASAIDKPRLSPDMVIGFEFDLVLGSSYARGTPDASKVKRLTAQIVGFSDQATLVGITIPEATVRRWNGEHSARSPLSAAYVLTEGANAAGPVARAIEKAGFGVDDTAKIVGAAIAVAGVLIGMFGGTLLLLSAFAIAQTFFLLVGERRLELAILRALGAKRRDLRRMVLLEAAAVGSVGGMLGVSGGCAAAWVLDRLIVSRIPDIAFKPEHIVALPPILIASAFLLGLAASLLGAAVPAARAASANPASALRS
jgi:ABC-type antimicrobial peptide transport system permease subunit